MMLAIQAGVSSPPATMIVGSAVRTDLTTANTSHTIDLPAHEAGDILVVFVSVKYYSGAQSTLYTIAATGWTIEQYGLNGGATNYMGVGALLYKTATSSAETLTITQDVLSTTVAAIGYSIRNATSVDSAYLSDTVSDVEMSVTFPALSASSGVWLRGWVTISRYGAETPDLTYLPINWSNKLACNIVSLNEAPAVVTFTRPDQPGSVEANTTQCSAYMLTDVSWTVAISP